MATLCLHFVEKRCGYFMFTFVIFVMESRFSGKFIFVSENASSFFILAQKPIIFTEISTETHKNLSESTKNIATAVNKRLAPLWVRFYFGKFTLKIKFGYICDVHGKLPQRQAKRRDVIGYNRRKFCRIYSDYSHQNFASKTSKIDFDSAEF